MENKPQIDLNVTNDCNFRCVHCGFDSGKVRLGEMSLDFAKTVLTDFKKIGGLKVDFTGGEPLLNKDLIVMVEFASSIGLKTKVVTNGSLCSAEKLEQLKAAGLNGISVSIDGSDYSSFNKVRPTSEMLYKKVVQCVKDSVALGLYTKINTVVFNSNFDDLENVIEQAIDLGCNEIRFCYFAPLGRGVAQTDLVANPEKWLVFAKQKFEQYKNEIKIVNALPMIETSKTSETSETSKTSETGCLVKRMNFLQIFPNGDAYPCSIMASISEPIINLNKCSLQEFWLNKDKMASEYYQKNIQPLFDKYGGCLDFKVKEGFKFVCQARKFCSR